MPGIQGARAPPSPTNHRLGVELRLCGRSQSCSGLQTWGRRRGTGRERVALRRSGLVSEQHAPGWGSGGRVRPRWEAGFWKGTWRGFIVGTQVSFLFPFKVSSAPCPQLALFPIPVNSRAPTHLSFCGMGCRISGFPLFPGKSAGKDLTESPPSVGCPPVL